MQTAMRRTKNAATAYVIIHPEFMIQPKLHLKLWQHARTLWTMTATEKQIALIQTATVLLDAAQ